MNVVSFPPLINVILVHVLNRYLLFYIPFLSVCLLKSIRFNLFIFFFLAIKNLVKDKMSIFKKKKKKSLFCVPAKLSGESNRQESTL